MRDVVTMLQYGTSKAATAESIGIPILRMNNIQGDDWDLSDLKYIELPDAEAETYRLQPGDILFDRTNSKELVGKCAVFREQGHWVFASYLIRVRLNESKALPDFVSIFLNTHAGRAQIDQISRQIIGMSNINAQEIRDLLIPLPDDLEIQHALVVQLQTVRTACQRKLSAADAVLAGFDKFLLRSLGVMPSKADKRQIYAVKVSECRGGRCDPLYHQPHYSKLRSALTACQYPKIPLGILSPRIVGGATPARGSAELYADSGVKFLRIMNIAPHGIDLSDIKHIQDKVHNGDLSRSRLAPDDILMTITGRVGTAAVVPEDILPANINQHIVRLRIEGARCLPRYLAAYLNSSIGTALSNREVTGGTRIALDYTAIRNLLIPVPPIQVQRNVVAELDRCQAMARRLRAEGVQEWEAAKAWFEAQLLGEER